MQWSRPKLMMQAVYIHAWWQLPIASRFLAGRSDPGSCIASVASHPSPTPPHKLPTRTAGIVPPSQSFTWFCLRTSVRGSHTFRCLQLAYFVVEFTALAVCVLFDMRAARHAWHPQDNYRRLGTWEYIVSCEKCSCAVLRSSTGCLDAFNCRISKQFQLTSLVLLLSAANVGGSPNAAVVSSK